MGPTTSPAATAANTTSTNTASSTTHTSSSTITPVRVTRPGTAVGVSTRRKVVTRSSGNISTGLQDQEDGSSNVTSGTVSILKYQDAPIVQTAPKETPVDNQEVPTTNHKVPAKEEISPKPAPVDTSSDKDSQGISSDKSSPGTSTYQAGTSADKVGTSSDKVGTSADKVGTSADRGTYVVCGSSRAGHVIRLRPTTTSGGRRKPSLTSVLTSRGGAVRYQGRQGQGDPSQGQQSEGQGQSSQGVLVSIMKRPSTTPGLSPSMRAAIAVSAGRNSRRHVKVKTRDGKELRTRDSSGDSSRASSPETEGGHSRPRSRASRSAYEWGSGARHRSASEEGRRYSGGSTGSTRPTTSPGKPVTYKLSTIKRTIQACRTLTAMGKAAKKGEAPQIQGEYRARASSARTAAERASPGGHNLRSKSVVVRREDEDSDIPQNLVYGTESYYEVINRLCRPTVASVARASMKLIRAGGPTTDEPTVVNQNVKREPPPWLTEEFLSRRFRGEQRASPEEVEEIVLRLCQPVSYHAPEPPSEPPEGRLALRRPTNSKFGIVQSYMWTCGDKMEQTQWDRKTVEISKRNYQAERGRMERRIAQLGHTGSGSDVMRLSLPAPTRPLVAPCGVNMMSRSLYKTPLYNTV